MRFRTIFGVVAVAAFALAGCQTARPAPRPAPIAAEDAGRGTMERALLVARRAAQEAYSLKRGDAGLAESEPAILGPFPYPPDPTQQQINCMDGAYLDYIDAVIDCIQNHGGSELEACITDANIEYLRAYLACGAV